MFCYKLFMKKLVKFHLSVDDVFESLIEISDKNIKLKDHWFFSYLYKIYKKYNVRIAIYLFYESKVKNIHRNLSEVRSIKKELVENWLYFGGHALNFENPPHKLKPQTQKKHIDKIYKEIIRFAGRRYLAKNVRLHEYSECYELKDTLKKYNIKSLFKTDKLVATYKMTKINKEELLNKGLTSFKGVNFVRTDLRVEDITIKKSFDHIKDILNNKNTLTVYSHEYELKKKKCRDNFIKILTILNKIYSLKSVSP